MDRKLIKSTVDKSVEQDHYPVSGCLGSRRPKIGWLLPVCHEPVANAHHAGKLAWERGPGLARFRLLIARRRSGREVSLPEGPGIPNSATSFQEAA